MATLIDDILEQVSRVVDDSASELEAFTPLLRLPVVHFDWVDTGDVYTKLHTFGVCNGTPFLLLVGISACWHHQSRGVSVVYLRGRMWC